jgi:hypothetical protein
MKELISECARCGRKNYDPEIKECNHYKEPVVYDVKPKVKLNKGLPNGTKVEVPYNVANRSKFIHSNLKFHGKTFGTIIRNVILQYPDGSPREPLEGEENSYEIDLGNSTKLIGIKEKDFTVLKK